MLCTFHRNLVKRKILTETLERDVISEYGASLINSYARIIKVREHQKITTSTVGQIFG
jgi:hypothetical protein